MFKAEYKQLSSKEKNSWNKLASQQQAPSTASTSSTAPTTSVLATQSSGPNPSSPRPMVHHQSFPHPAK
ncbi:hypothetical protein BT69DRAFT_1280118 [Atractiella rhizophila]|nr:hypothetical protein BT69DRAFT_1280118 [Atractiella rhizophila]